MNRKVLVATSILTSLIPLVAIFWMIKSRAHRAEMQDLSRFEATITSQSPRGMKYSDFRMRLMNQFQFDYVVDWDKAMVTQAGVLIHAEKRRDDGDPKVLHGPLGYRTVIEATFDENKNLESIVVHRWSDNF